MRPGQHRRRALPRRALCTALAAVTASAPAAAHDAPEWLDPRLGGDTTVTVANEHAYARPAANLSTRDLRLFAFGNRLFNTNWVAAPASVDALDGLGPLFNRVSCSGCHTRDGRGRPPESPEGPFESLLLRMSLPGGASGEEPLPVPRYGRQLNERALPGIPPEGRGVLHYTERAGSYPDGTPYTLLVPRYGIAEPGYGPLPDDLLLSPRVAPPVFGLGLLEAVPEEAILARADPDDADGDGISGRPNRVRDAETGGMVLGRFGWKANQPSVRLQNAAAAHEDIGLTSSVFPAQNVEEGQTAAAAAAGADAQGRLELEDEFLDRLTFYARTLAVPAGRRFEDPVVRAGARAFEAVRCTACNVPTMTTGEHPELPQLSRQVIHAYTDLLLHDMGEGLGDGRPDFHADGREWRTPPLWGIGLTKVVNRHTRFLHDGRARSIEEAILWHDGEARASREAYMHLPREERAALLEFLENL